MTPPQSGERTAATSAARGAAWLAKQVELALAEVDLTLPQYRLLCLLDEGDAAASWAAERLAVSPPSVTAIVDGLVTRSLVQRSSVRGDRRRVNLALTDGGIEALRRADKSVSRHLEQAISVGGAGLVVDDAFNILKWWLDAKNASLDSAREGS